MRIMLRDSTILLQCTFLIVLQVGRCVEIPLVVRRERSISLARIDTQQNAVVSSTNIVHGIDESFPVLITAHISKGILAYMESWSRSLSDKIRTITFRIVDDATERTDSRRGKKKLSNSSANDEFDNHSETDSASLPLLASSSLSLSLLSFPSHHTFSSSSTYINRNTGGGIIEETITSLAIDWITNQLYLGVETASVHNAGRIEVCLLAMTGNNYCAIILHSTVTNSYHYPPHAHTHHNYVNHHAAIITARVDALHSLVLDPLDGYMYWLNRVHKRIERAWMDGRHHDAYPFKEDTTDVITTAALTLEQKTRTLYYTRTKMSSEDSQLWSCHLYDRESCRMVVSGVKNAFSLDVFDDFLIWTSVSSQNSGITICKREDCDGTMRDLAHSQGIEALRVLDQRSQPPRISPNPCAKGNGGCSHICVLIAGAPWRACLCPIGVKLLEDRLTCAPNGVDRVLLVATTSGLIYISLDTDDYTPLPIKFVAANNDMNNNNNNNQNKNGIEEWKIVDVDYDGVEKKIYFIDAETRTIQRCDFNGSNLERVFVEDDLTDSNTHHKSEALTIDWLNRNLYWFDSNMPQIKIQSLDERNGLHHYTIISDGLKQPRGLAIEPLAGYLYFSDWHETTSHIERTWLDGTHRIVLIALEKDAWPNGIAVDGHQNRIYWVEGRRSLIKSAALDDGSDIQILSTAINHPYSISKLGNTLYVNSLYGRKICALKIPSYKHRGTQSQQQRQAEENYSEKKNGTEWRSVLKGSDNDSEMIDDKLDKGMLRVDDMKIISDSIIFGQMGIRAVHLNNLGDQSPPVAQNVNDDENGVKYSDSFLSPCQTNRGDCAHICVKLPNGNRGCLCAMGYELRADNKSCVMPRAFILYAPSIINNVDIKNTTNIPGVGGSGLMRISLEKAPTPANNQRINIANMSLSTLITFDIDQNSKRIFWVSEEKLQRNGIISYVLRSSYLNGTDLKTITESVSSMNYISVDWITGNIYWCNEDEKRIEMIDKNGKGHRTIVWESVKPRHIAVHPIKLFFIFVNAIDANHFVINKSPLEGHRSGGRVLISERRHSFTVKAVAIDFDSDLIVWSEVDGSSVSDSIGTISVIDFNGANRVQLLSSERFQAFSLSIYQKKIYYWNARTRSIEVYDKEFGKIDIVHSNFTFTSIHQLVIVHGNAPKGWNECVNNNGGCDGICVPVNNMMKKLDAESNYDSDNNHDINNNNRNTSVKCLCDDHFTTNESNKKCIPPRKFVLMASRGRLIRFNLRKTHLPSLSWRHDAYTTLSVSNVGTPSSIGFDSFSANRSIYWISSHDNKFMKRASDLGINSVTQTISLSRHSGCTILFALAIDELGRQLFVSCAEHGVSHTHAASIHIWRIKDNDNLQYIGVVVSGRERSSVTNRPPYPRQFVIFPRLNLLFYVDAGDKVPLIVRCLLNGRECVRWDTPNLTSFVRLHANQANNRLYYTAANGLWSRDAHVFSDVRHHIESDQLDAIEVAPISEKRMIVIMRNESESEGDTLMELEDDLKRSLTLEELKLRMYYEIKKKSNKRPETEWLSSQSPLSSEWSSGSVMKMRRIVALSVVGLDTHDSATRTCATSHCSHMCRIPKESTHRVECLCPLGYSLQTPNGSICYEHMMCAKWQFKCTDGKQCVHLSTKCNAFEDCVDGSDETHCHNMQNPQNWPCDDGKTTIARRLLCNGVSDCEDNSDETHCRCGNPSNEFDCGILQKELIKTDYDYHLRPATRAAIVGMARHRARIHHHHHHHHRLSNYVIDKEEMEQCIDRSKLCDGFANCANGSDENKEICSGLAMGNDREGSDSSRHPSSFNGGNDGAGLSSVKEVVNRDDDDTSLTAKGSDTDLAGGTAIGSRRRDGSAVFLDDEVLAEGDSQSAIAEKHPKSASSPSETMLLGSFEMLIPMIILFVVICVCVSVCCCHLTTSSRRLQVTTTRNARGRATILEQQRNCFIDNNDEENMAMMMMSMNMAASAGAANSTMANANLSLALNSTHPFYNNNNNCCVVVGDNENVMTGRQQAHFTSASSTKLLKANNNGSTGAAAAANCRLNSRNGRHTRGQHGHSHTHPHHDRDHKKNRSHHHVLAANDQYSHCVMAESTALNPSAEARVLLPANSDGTQVELQLRTFSRTATGLGTSSSILYNALPPPNSQISLSSAVCCDDDNHNANRNYEERLTNYERSILSGRCSSSEDAASTNSKNANHSFRLRMENENGKINKNKSSNKKKAKKNFSHIIGGIIKQQRHHRRNNNNSTSEQRLYKCHNNIDNNDKRYGDNDDDNEEEYKQQFYAPPPSAASLSTYGVVKPAGMIKILRLTADASEQQVCYDQHCLHQQHRLERPHIGESKRLDIGGGTKSTATVGRVGLRNADGGKETNVAAGSRGAHSALGRPQLIGEASEASSHKSHHRHHHSHRRRRRQRGEQNVKQSVSANQNLKPANLLNQLQPAAAAAAVIQNFYPTTESRTPPPSYSQVASSVNSIINEQLQRKEQVVQQQQLQLEQHHYHHHHYHHYVDATTKMMMLNGNDKRREKQQKRTSRKCHNHQNIGIAQVHLCDAREHFHIDCRSSDRRSAKRNNSHGSKRNNQRSSSSRKQHPEHELNFERQVPTQQMEEAEIGRVYERESGFGTSPERKMHLEEMVDFERGERLKEEEDESLVLGVRLDEGEGSSEYDSDDYEYDDEKDERWRNRRRSTATVAAATSDDGRRAPLNSRIVSPLLNSRSNSFTSTSCSSSYKGEAPRPESEVETRARSRQQLQLQPKSQTCSPDQKACSSLSLSVSSFTSSKFSTTSLLSSSSSSSSSAESSS